MPRRELRLHLLVPGLFGPLPRRAIGGCDWPRPPFLERLLARGDRTSLSVRGLPELLFHMFGLSTESDSELPSASLCRLAEGLPADHACWMHADPVHLEPDLHRVLLFDTRHLQLPREQAEQLAHQVEAFYRGDGWRLQVAAPGRWYLRLPQAPDLRTQPLEQVVGRNIEPFLPAGPDAGPWRTRLNEVQMLLYDSEVNLERERLGQAPINGLWFWGAGRLPAASAATPFAAVYADRLLARGLALYCGVTPLAPPPAADQLLQAQAAGEVLVVLDQLSGPLLDADPASWKDALEGLEKTWFEPLGRALGSRLRCLYLYPAQQHRYRVGPASLRRLWRRRRPLESYLRTELEWQDRPAM